MLSQMRLVVTPVCPSGVSVVSTPGHVKDGWRWYACATPGDARRRRQCWLELEGAQRRQERARNRPWTRAPEVAHGPTKRKTGYFLFKYHFSIFFPKSGIYIKWYSPL